jgi:phosphoribosyl 1,2-cyclic phosphodiesterase
MMVAMSEHTLQTNLIVRFWGVRGSVPCPGAEYARYGGNTSCVSVEAGGHLFIFDAGTGLRPLGQYVQEHQIHDLTLLFSHTHFDHISGLPFFTPAYDAAYTISLYAGHLQQPLKEVLKTAMGAPFFPISPSTFKARLQYTDFTPGIPIEKGTVTIRTTPLNHPDGAIGYRLEHNGRSVCYITDTEHRDTPDENILTLIAGADLVIYDSMFAGDDYAEHQGWGHSSVEEAMKLCQMAGVRQLALFHHNPDYTDAKMDDIEAAAKHNWSGVFAAREGGTVRL